MKKISEKIRRQLRIRGRLKRLPTERPRLTVHRTGKHIYAQIIDDAAGHTLAAASSLDTSFTKAKKLGSNKDAAGQVGKLVAERGKAAGVSQVRFDRGAYIYHGRIAALAEAAREGGLDF
jgi:large subunit ribosomal protein L18